MDRQPELRDVFLHGALAQQFGRRFRLAVSTPAEAVRALSVQIKGFRAAIGEGLYRVVTTHGRERRVYLADTLDVGSGPVPLHIVPVIAGAGGGRGTAIGLTVAGAALIAAAIAAPLIVPFGAATVLGMSPMTVGTVGLALALHGISMLIAPKPKLDGGKADSRHDSFLFGGAPDRPVAGRPVPVTFGEFQVTCIPISVQFNVAQIAP